MHLEVKRCVSTMLWKAKVKLGLCIQKIKVGEKGKEELRRMLQTKINRQVLTGFTSILDPAFRLGEME